MVEGEGDLLHSLHVGSLPLGHYCELTVNTLATLNNLSFHALQDSYILHAQQHLSRCKHFIYVFFIR